MSEAKSAASNDRELRAARRREGLAQYRKALRYAFHVITHPFDGFWDMAHEHKGNLAAATTFLVLFMVVRVLKLMCTSFQFISAPLQHVNIFEQVASLLIPFLVLCLANWAMTTLFDGKGRFRDIYIAMCYAMVPYILIQSVMILVSNMITYEEGSFYSVILGISVIWCAFLVFVGLMQVHDYSPGKTLIFMVVTVVGAMVILFLVLVFFSLLSDAAAYFISIYREIIYRLY